MERFYCTELLLGKEKVENLKRSFAVIVGLGAVGSYAAEGLARSGTGRIRLVDFDVIKPTNFNRHLGALMSTLGKPKVEAAASRIAQINPDCRTEALRIFADPQSTEAVLGGGPDIVLDAIDSVGPKAGLLEACHRRKIPVISSMGAALRRNILGVKAGDLFRTSGCPLAKKIRTRLRRAGIRSGIFCVYSDEPVPPADGLGDPLLNEEDDYDRGRKRRKLGSLPTVTGVFGLVLAHYAIAYLSGDEDVRKRIRPV